MVLMVLALCCMGPMACGRSSAYGRPGSVLGCMPCSTLAHAEHGCAVTRQVCGNWARFHGDGGAIVSSTRTGTSASTSTSTS